MASLNPDSRRSAGYFFDRENSVTVDDETDFPLIGNRNVNFQDDDTDFKAINTTWAIVSEIILVVGHLIVVYLIPAQCSSANGHTTCREDPYSIIIFLASGYWFVVFIFDQYYKVMHNKSRCNGYLEFFRETKNIRHGPLLVHSMGCALLLVVVMLLQDYCPNKVHCSKALSLKPFNYIQLVVSIEVLLCLIILFIYLVKTIRFNSKRAVPDVAQDELMSSFMQSNTHSDIGIREDDFLDDVLEKQADMIRYLKQRNDHLSRKILFITNERNSKKSAYF